MLERRLQVLLDEDRYQRLVHAARTRGVSVATVVREAIDSSVPPLSFRRSAAAREVLDAPCMPVPSQPELRIELDEIRGSRR